jgi:hypothetical protein
MEPDKLNYITGNKKLLMPDKNNIFLLKYIINIQLNGPINY